MKKLLLFALLTASLSSFAQYSSFSYATEYNQINYDLPENKIPPLVLISGVAVNTSIRYSDKFEAMTIKDRNQTMLTGYLTTVIVTYGTHVIIKYCRTHKVFKRNHKRKKF